MRGRERDREMDGLRDRHRERQGEREGERCRESWRGKEGDRGRERGREENFTPTALSLNDVWEVRLLGGPEARRHTWEELPSLPTEKAAPFERTHSYTHETKAVSKPFFIVPVKKKKKLNLNM